MKNGNTCSSVRALNVKQNGMGEGQGVALKTHLELIHESSNEYFFTKYLYLAKI